MKQLLCILAFLTAHHAQAQLDVTEICTKLEQMDVFIQCARFKDDFATKNKQLAGNPLIGYAEFEKLHYAFDEVRTKYNDFLGLIREDLTEWTAIKQMSSNPEKFSLRYQEGFQLLQKAYEETYLPVYNEIYGKISTKGKPSFAQIFQIGSNILFSIIDLIKQRKEHKEEQRNALLSTINQSFFNKLKLPSWAEQDLAFQGKSTSPESNQGSSTTSPKPSYRTKVDIEPAFMQEMQGFIEFIYKNEQGVDEKMAFANTKGGLTISVSERTDVNDLYGTPRNIVCPKTFIAAQRYPIGTEFYLRVNNTAGMYILALNGATDIEFLHPAPQKGIKGGLTISSPLDNKDRDGSVILPEPDYTRQPPLPRYFKIYNDGTSQVQFCILLSRSIINMKEIETLLEQQSGSLSERLGKVFGSDMIDPSEAGVSLSGNRVVFDASTSAKNILPISFIINN